jgi:hypothetical protein
MGNWPAGSPNRVTTVVDFAGLLRCPSGTGIPDVPVNLDGTVLLAIAAAMISVGLLAAALLI